MPIELTAGELAMIEANRQKAAALKAEKEAERKLSDEKGITEAKKAQAEIIRAQPVKPKPQVQKAGQK